MDYQSAGENIIWTGVGYGNSIAINLGEKVFIVDSMLNWELAAEWREMVEEYFQIKVGGLILTHHHPDHVFGNQIFSDVPIIASTGTKDMMKNFQTEYWENVDQAEREDWENGGYGIEGFQFTLPTICFEQTYQLKGPRTLDLIRVDGHTTGSTYLWLADTKILIAGDLVFNREGPFGADESCNIIQWQKAMEELIDLNPDIVISGHGPTATIQDLTEINDFFKASIDFIQDKLVAGFTSEEIETDPKFPDYYYSERKERKTRSIQHWIRFLKEIG